MPAGVDCTDSRSVEDEPEAVVGFVEKGSSPPTALSKAYRSNGGGGGNSSMLWNSSFDVLETEDHCLLEGGTIDGLGVVSASVSGGTDDGEGRLDVAGEDGSPELGSEVLWFSPSTGAAVVIVFGMRKRKPRAIEPLTYSASVRCTKKKMRDPCFGATAIMVAEGLLSGRGTSSSVAGEGDEERVGSSSMGPVAVS